MNRLYLFSILALGLVLAFPIQAREVVPAPAVGEGVNTLAADLALPFTGAAPRDQGKIMPGEQDLRTQFKQALSDKTTWDEIGGDDVAIELGDDMGRCDIEIASNGYIYAAVAYSYLLNGRIEVYRSTDRGKTWDDWGVFIAPGEFDDVDHPDLVIGEGLEDRCFLAYIYGNLGGWDIVVAYSPTSSPTGDWTPVVAMPGGAVGYQLPKIVTDAPNFTDYFLYLVAQGRDGNGDDIWFARSTNQGDSFEDPYKIGSLSLSDREYYQPEISYGLGGNVCVSWNFRHYENVFDSAIRFRVASSYANGGLGSWDSIKATTSSSDDFFDKSALVAASKASTDVLIIHRRGFYIGETYIHADPVVHHSTDSGANFAPGESIGNGMALIRTLEQRTNDGAWILGGAWNQESAVQWAAEADPTTWSDPVCFPDYNYPGAIGSGKPVAIYQNTGDLAAVWACPSGHAESGFHFDAEWRSDPGFPNNEPGFPLGLWAPPISPPAVVDVDGDGDLEIVFSDALRQIQVLNHDGSSAPGWPQDVGVNLSDGPVAVGDLNGDGQLTLVVGGTDGNAYAYDHLGNLLPGWPTAITPPGIDIYVSIGAVGGPYPRSVVCAGANYITLRSHHGVAPPGTIGWSIGGGASFTEPAVIGDIDDDGISEIVGSLGTRVFAFKKGVNPMDWLVTIPNPLSDALTLGDLDLDGDLEILCPSAVGTLYVLDHTGTQLGGNFPYETGVPGSLTSAALAHFAGSSEPDIVFAHSHWTVHALHHDGSLITGYPTNTTPNWFIYGAPVIGPVNGSPTDVIVGDRGRRVWAWTNVGFLLWGWPHEVQNQVNLSPAIGDIDLDGNNEIVVLTETQVFVMDVNSSVGGYLGIWGMYGHDPQRTGCADCPEDLLSPVGPGLGDGAVTRVSFTGASPNPVSGGTQFSFAVPLRSAVSLDILDLRGARVYTVYREETEAGAQVITWNGRDASGRPLASGAYFARLKVKGPGLNEELTRKLMVVK